SGSASATAQRFTSVNLEEPDPSRRPQPVKVKDPASGREGWYEQYLIHRTRSGTLVSSKAEVVVANELDYAREKRWLTYQYEGRLPAADGTSHLPEFTIPAELSRTLYCKPSRMRENTASADRWPNTLMW